MLLSLILESFGDLSFVTFILYFKSLIEICQESAERLKSELEKANFSAEVNFTPVCNRSNFLEKS